jgi:DNA helicase II / ATP-dependent DNA helicase PcrA
MTRARDELFLLAPLKYYVTEQRRYGAAHVYGARSRFLTDSVCACLETEVWPAQAAREASLPPAPVRIDVVQRLKSLWD